METCVEYVDRYKKELSAALCNIHGLDIKDVGGVLWRCWQSDRTLFVVGNGGSWATASHLVTDLCKGLYVATGSGMKVVNLMDNIPSLTAWANDMDYDHAAAMQLKAMAGPHDTILVISGSGNSENILNTLAESIGSRPTIALTGMGGGGAEKMSSHGVVVKSNNMQIVEDCHMAICHMLFCYLRDRKLGLIDK